MHKICEPEILYFGTPVVIISTCNEDGSYNIAPISSIFWLGWRCVIGIFSFSKTTENIRRSGECALNLPSVSEVGAVNRLALTTGSNPVPEGKKRKGYRFVLYDFKQSGLLHDITPFRHFLSRNILTPGELTGQFHFFVNQFVF